MLVTNEKSIEELKEMLKEKKIFLISCRGCAEVCETGGEKAEKKRIEELKDIGKEILGLISVDYLCYAPLISLKIKKYPELENSEALLILSCGIGVQSVSSVIQKPVYPSCNTLSLEGIQGLFPGEERCAECGDCLLGYTGGICPFTACSKGLINGQCGGDKNGFCEVKNEKECGWEKIYRRLSSINKLSNLAEIKIGRKYSNLIADEKLRKSKYYSYENQEEVF